VGIDILEKALYSDGMKNEVEFADIYLDFNWKRGTSSALWRGNSKSEMSQHVKDIHIDLITADQWTETLSPLQNPSEVNGATYFKLHAQVLMNRTDAPDNL
jgi:hypothetical protein